MHDQYNQKKLNIGGLNAHLMFIICLTKLNSKKEYREEHGANGEHECGEEDGSRDLVRKELHGIGDSASTQAMADEDHLKDMDFLRTNKVTCRGYERHDRNAN